MQYSHTQHGRFHHIMYVSVAVLLGLAWVSRAAAFPMWILVGTAALVFFFSQTLHYMTVRDDGDALAIRFGPIPLLGTRIPYARITAVEPGRSSIADGWGVHWVPGRGWTYNIWGFDCVVLHLGSRVIRVGSDDVENLVAFLNERIARSEG